MEKIRLFIRATSAARSLEQIIVGVAENLGIDMAVQTSCEMGVYELPRGYDGYLIHLSDTTERDIQALKQDQPWSKIFGLTGCGSEIRVDSVDGIYYLVGLEEAAEILKEVCEIYDEEQD